MAGIAGSQAGMKGSKQPAAALAEEPPSKRSRTTKTSQVVVGWFRNDLRVSDNPMLQEVKQRAEEKNLPAVLVYILDPRFYDRSDYGRVTDQSLPGKSAMLRGDAFASRKCNGRRARFYLNVLRDLQRCLGEIGSELCVFYGKPEDVFANLSEEYGVLDVVCLREPVSPEWTDVEKFVTKTLQKSGGSLTRLWGAMSLYHEEDVPFKFKEAPNNYTGLAKDLGWRDIWTSLEQFWWAAPIREPIPALKGWTLAKVKAPRGVWTQELLDNDHNAMQRLGFTPEEIEETLKVAHGGSRKGKGGETAAWLRFNAWMAIDPTPVKHDPNFVALGGEYGAAGAKFLAEGEIDPFQWKNLSTSAGWMALSKYMACGCISPREMYHTLLRKKHWALPGLVHRFMWREWHRINAIKYQTHLFRLQGPGGQYHFPRYGSSENGQRWKEAKTGIPYIDACMNELNQTGWLPYHKRKTVACFLCHDLSVDWRFGAFHFEEVLLDYDVAMNYGNWTFCARVDKPYGDRYMASHYRDPEHWSSWKSIQANAGNDPNGDYIRQWVPELRQVPKQWINHPWMMTQQEMKDAGCIIGKNYPGPLVQFPQVQLTDSSGMKAGPLASFWETLTNLPGMATLEMVAKFPSVGLIFLLIVYMSGLIDNPNSIAKQLLIVCSHNIAIGYLFDKAPEGIYVGFPHFGPLSVDIPVLRILARFWSYEMVAIRWATAMRPKFVPGLFASYMSLIIPQSAVFASSFLAVMTSDYFKNPISFASVNGFPALIWLMWFLFRYMSWNITDLVTVWVDVEDFRVDPLGVALFLLPFIALAVYKAISLFGRVTPPSRFPANGKTFFFLHSAIFAPLYLYLLYAGWKLEDVHKVMYATASWIPIWWVNYLGGVDLWIEEPLGMPARFIAFTPTWIVSHGVYFLQWALDPQDYINRLIFVFYFCPQMVYLNFYFRKACRQDWGTQLPIYFSYFMHWHMTAMELYKLWVDYQVVGFSEIYSTVFKDCPLHFTTAQMAVLATICVLQVVAPNARCRWALYSSLGPLNWLGLI